MENNGISTFQYSSNESEYNSFSGTENDSGILGTPEDALFNAEFDKLDQGKVAFPKNRHSSTDSLNNSGNGTRNACCVYDFTAQNNGKHTVQEIIDLLKKNCKKWCFQLEKAPTTNSEHYQGRISLKVKVRLPQLLTLFPNCNWHWSVTSSANRDNQFYVMKEDTRIAGPWKDDDPYIPKQVREIKELRPWQKFIIDDKENWDPRTINLVYDPKGNSGKSILKAWIGSKKIGQTVVYQDNYKDLMRQVMDKEKRSLYIFDIPRALTRNERELYGAIESIKDGHAFDDRYTFREEYFDSPNIWVFVNSLPDEKLLSVDRWKRWQIMRDDWTLKDFKAVPCNTKLKSLEPVAPEKKKKKKNFRNF